ncbi:MAG: AmmeMemoRadiSam system radical SAM enzyme [Elusimicrobia bacterium]|nr:AmmeMemoRadiSam system radical SAM enzyme [Elusimicrobiota bacterium]
METLAATLKRLTAPASRAPGGLARPLADGRLECLACGLRCRLKDGQAGACRVRFREEGELRVPWGYVAGLQVDPIEKKPFYHALPGAKAMSFGMLGCCYSCEFCQNWESSQTLRDPRAGHAVRECAPREIVRLAVENGARVVTSTYNEPLITAEWAAAVFKEAKEAGLRCSFVSNGNATPEVIDYLKPWVDLFKVDLKCFDEGRYRRLMGGPLRPVLDAIGLLWAKGFWVEVVTLVIPGVNDSDSELDAIARFIVSVSKDIPWHVTAYHRDFKMEGAAGTPAATLLRAAEAGRAAGLRYVYAGNLPGAVGGWEDTACPGCRLPLIERRGFMVLRSRLKVEGGEGSCPECLTRIAGVWA